MIGQIQKQRQVFQYVLILDIMIVLGLEVLMEELVCIRLRMRLFDYLYFFMDVIDGVWGMEYGGWKGFFLYCYIDII